MTIIFNNIDDIKDMAHWDKKPIEIIDVLADPDADHNSDPSSLPMLRAKLTETGEVKNIYPEEIEKKHWPATLSAALDGMLTRIGEADHPCPSEAELAKYYQFGKLCGDYRV